MDEIEQGQQVLRDVADADVTAAVEARVNAGTARWILDPEVEGVVGVTDAETGRALVVVYVNREDFELSDEFEDSIW